MRVLFGHQSVGANLLQGLAALGAAGFAGAIGELSDASATSAAAKELLVHVRVGSNGDPMSKLRDFVDKLRSANALGLNLALLKFCYVDVVEQRAAEKLLVEYCATMDVLQADHPTLRIGHVTVPLRSAPTGALAAVRQALQGPHAEHRRNAVREWFNRELRQRFVASGTLFDLAAVEAHDPQGRAVYSIAAGQRVPSLASQWTNDGGHLNVVGSKMAAQSFLQYLRTFEVQTAAATR